jgi:GntP family gluconate:H+ symporter
MPPDSWCYTCLDHDGIAWFRKSTRAVWNNLPVIAGAANPQSWYLPACVAGTVMTLLLLIARLRLHPALALMIGALGLGVASGMPLAKVPLSFTTGVGNLMGHIAIILGLGAVLGRLLARSGAATALGSFLVEIFGPGGVSWALLILGIVVGMPVFFEVGLVLLMPIVIAAARQSGRPPILVAIPLLAGLSIMHGLVPPHPAAMLAAAQYHADMGRTIFWGLIVGIPAAVIAGPLLGWVLTQRWLRKVPQPLIRVADQDSVPLSVELSTGSGAPEPVLSLPKDPDSRTWESTDPAPNAERPRPASSGAVPEPAGPARAAFAILLPIALIFLGSWAEALAAPGSVLNRLLHFAGSPDIALLIAVLVGLVILGPRIQDGRHHGRELLRKLTAESFEPIANAMVILSAAGGLSGVLRESGAAQATVGLAMGAHMPPLVLAWLLAAVVRVSMGSATVAMAVASGVLAPLVEHAGVRPELLVLATGSGSLMLSHVNDSGFWLVQSLFNLEMKQTLATWSVVETVLSVAGLGGTLVMSALLR